MLGRFRTGWSSSAVPETRTNPFRSQIFSSTKPMAKPQTEDNATPLPPPLGEEPSSTGLRCLPEDPRDGTDDLPDLIEGLRGQMEGPEHVMEGIRDQLDGLRHVIEGIRGLIEGLGYVMGGL